jgi:proline iminopeptidase
LSARDRYLTFRRSLPPRPPLERLTVHARGLEFAVWRTPAVDGATPLLCINGGLLFGHELLWPVLSPLARRRQLYLYDQRGRGASSAAPGIGASRIEFDAGDVPALREALAIPRWDMLGHSWGGGIALLAAAADPRRVRRLVLVDSVGVTSEWLPPLHEAALARLTGSAQARLAALGTDALRERNVSRHAEYAQAFFPAWFADMSFGASVAPPRGTSETGTAVAARLRRDGYDWRSAIRDVIAPTLVVHGAADVLPLTEAERLVSSIRGARLAAIPEAGHNPFWEAPDEFFTVVDAFLEEPLPDF